MTVKDLLKVAWFGDVIINYHNHEFRIVLDSKEALDGVLNTFTNEFLNAQVENVGANEDMLLVNVK